MAFSIPIQPMSSHCFRCVVNPFITYFESVIILIGVSGLIDCRATRTAASSPLWLVCFVPGILSALFNGLFSSSHIPLPHTAFCLPLCMQDPSV
jgi:hypothetical protein